MAIPQQLTAKTRHVSEAETPAYVKVNMYVASLNPAPGQWELPHSNVIFGTWIIVSEYRLRHSS